MNYILLKSKVNGNASASNYFTFIPFYLFKQLKNRYKSYFKVLSSGIVGFM